jgi:CheY-like chemotaxis protein
MSGAAADGERILIAHEALDTALAVAALLLSRGFRVDIATDAEQTREKLSAGIDALVVDLAMPGALGDALPSIARSFGARAVVALGEIHRSSSYRHKPTRLYGADRLVEMHQVSAKLADVLLELLATQRSALTSLQQDRRIEALCQRVLIFSGELEPAERTWISNEIESRRDGVVQRGAKEAKGGSRR